MAITTFNEQVWVENTLNATPALQVGSLTHSGDTSIFGTLTVTAVSANGVGTGFIIVNGPATSTFGGNVSINSPGVLTTAARASLLGGFTAPSGTITGSGTVTTLNATTATLTGTTTLSGAVTFTSATLPNFQNGLTAAGVIATSGTISAVGERVIGNPSLPVATSIDLQNQSGFATILTKGTTSHSGIVSGLGIQGSEYLGAFSLTSNVGSTATINSANKVALYSEAFVTEKVVINQGTTTHVSGSGPARSLNTLLYLDSNLTTLTTSNIPALPANNGWAAIGYELDVRNQSQYDFTNSGVSGKVIGLNISAQGINKVNSAIEIHGNDTAQATSNLFGTGLFFAGGSVSTSSITDYSNSVWSHYVSGSRYYGFDTTSAIFQSVGSAIRIGTQTSSNSQRIVAYDTQGSVDIPLLAYQNTGTSYTTGTICLGYNSGATLQINNNMIPITDNALNVGSNTFRFNSVYASSLVGTVAAPSSPSLKTDPADLPDMLPIVMSIRPQSFRWIVGGVDFINTKETLELPVQEAGPDKGRVITYRNGKAVLAEYEGILTRPIFEDAPVFDERGDPIILQPSEGRPAVLLVAISGTPMERN